METGTVKWFNNSKSYGLILSDTQEEIPVFNYKHDLLLEGQRVEFDRLKDCTIIPEFRFTTMCYLTSIATI